MDSLKIKIGPPSKAVFDSSVSSWSFDVPVIFVNESNRIVYLPIPIPKARGFLNFFLVSSDGVLLKERYIMTALLFGEDSLKKLEGGESISFLKHVVVSQVEENDASYEASDLQNIQFFSNGWLGDIYKIKDGDYKLYAKFTCLNQTPKQKKEWLKLAHLPINDLELSRIWHGEIESNKLILNLKKQEE